MAAIVTALFGYLFLLVSASALFRDNHPYVMCAAHAVRTIGSGLRCNGKGQIMCAMHASFTAQNLVIRAFYN